MCKEMKCLNWNKNKWLALTIALVCVFGGVLFALESHSHMHPDDWSCRYTYCYNGRVQSVAQIFGAAWDHFMGHGARIICRIWEYTFISYNDSIFPFYVANSIVFAILLFACGILISGEISQRLNIADYRSFFAATGIFSLMFWFLATAPSDTLIWWVGSVDYLWMTTASVLFLLLYYRYKDKEVNRWQGVLLFIASFYLGISNMMAVIGICGAFVVYYLFHIKEYRKSTAYILTGFAIGACILVFGPGNFVRYMDDKNAEIIPTLSATFSSSGFNVKYLIRSVLGLFAQYKTSWLMGIGLVFLLIKDRVAFKQYILDNQILLLSWFWSAIAFSFVFKPSLRALFYTELIALVLFLKIALPMMRTWQKAALSIVLLLAMCVDVPKAYADVCRLETQYNEAIDELVKNDGNLCFDDIHANHRMGQMIFFEPWQYRGLKIEYGLDSIVIHPLLWCNVYPEDIWCTDEHSLGFDYVYEAGERMIIRVPDSISNHGEIKCQVNYELPQSRKRDILKRLHLYKYDRSVQLTLPIPDCSNNGFDYYFVRPISSPDKIVNNICISEKE